MRITDQHLLFYVCHKAPGLVAAAEASKPKTVFPKLPVCPDVLSLIPLGHKISTEAHNNLAMLSMLRRRARREGRSVADLLRRPPHPTDSKRRNATFARWARKIEKQQSANSIPA